MQNRSVMMLACGAAALVVCSAAPGASLNRTDRDFVHTVATMDMTGAHEGQMAQEKASKPEVKDFARMVVKDDGESFGHLAELAAKNGVAIPRGINVARIPEVRGLSELHGVRFDRQFARDEAAAEQRVLAVFKREAKFGENGELKAYANNMIPVFDNDLRRAQQIVSTVK